jgi:hypothetical protein
MREIKMLLVTGCWFGVTRRLIAQAMQHNEPATSNQ